MLDAATLAIALTALVFALIGTATGGYALFQLATARKSSVVAPRTAADEEPALIELPLPGENAQRAYERVTVEEFHRREHMAALEQAERDIDEDDE